jgi:hypothetical protein
MKLLTTYCKIKLGQGLPLTQIPTFIIGLLAAMRRRCSSSRIIHGMDMMPTTVYSNTNASTEAATKSTTVNYDLSVLTNAWNMIFNVATSNPSLWDNLASAFDMVDSLDK